MTESYKDRTRPASWRGLPFEMESADIETGRRGEDIQFPGSDRTLADDAGKAPTKLSFTAWIAGPDHDLRAIDLFGAFGQEGFGELVHPIFGSLVGICRTGRMSHSRTEGGVTRVSIDFVESGEPSFPVPEILTLETVDVTAAKVEAAAEEEFTASWSVDGESAYVLSQARKALGGLSSRFRLTLGGPLAESVSLASAVKSAIVRWDDEYESLASDPAGEIVDRIVELTQLLDVIDALRSLYGSEPYPTPTTGLSSEELTARGNREALYRLLERAALAQAARVAAQTDFDLYGEAVALRNELSARIAAEARQDDAVSGVMTDLRGRVVEDINGRMADLARLRTYTVRRTTSSIEVAWELYGDPTRAAEVEELNEVEHPGFIVADLTVRSE